jgi:hypothetical protein
LGGAALKTESNHRQSTKHGSLRFKEDLQEILSGFHHLRRSTFCPVQLEVAQIEDVSIARSLIASNFYVNKFDLENVPLVYFQPAGNDPLMINRNLR